jgi:hypothetical protein
VGTGELFLPEVDQPGHEPEHSPQPSDEVKNFGAIPSLPKWLQGVVLNILSMGTNLPFCLLFSFPAVADPKSSSTPGPIRFGELYVCINRYPD